MKTTSLSFLAVTSLATALAGLACTTGNSPQNGGGAANDPDGGGATDPEASAPRVCTIACPSGYSCVEGICSGGDREALQFSVATFPVSGNLTANGTAPGAASCTGDQIAIELLQGPAPKSFLDPLRGSMISAKIACATADGSFATRVPAGIYRVLARSYNTTSSFPDATFLVNDAFAITGPTSQLAWNVSTVPIAGRITADGQAPTASCTSGAQVRITFINTAGASFDADVPCSAHDGAFATRVAPGTYRVLARTINTTSTFPDATFLVNDAFEVTGAANALAWNVKTVQVAGRISADGQTPRATCTSGSQVRLSFVDTAAAGASFDADVPCSATDGAFAARVAPGTYRVLARAINTTSTFPDATFVVKDAFQVTSAASGLAWDVSTVRVAGRITADGQTPTASCTSGAQVRVTFVNTAGASFDADVPCGTKDGAFEARVAPGTYRVLARSISTTSSFPDSTFVVKQAFQVSSAASGLAWDVSTVRVAGHITTDGHAPKATCTEGAQVRLTFFDDAGGAFDADVPCTTTDGSFDARVAPGVYGVLARNINTTSSFPDATFGLVEQLSIR